MRVVLIGLGKIARYHIAALAATSRYVLCGVCDSHPDAVSAALAGEVPFFDAYEPMLDALRPDVAVIATPPATHYEIAMACVKRHVTPYVEKPLAASGEEAGRFLQAPLQGNFIPMYHTVYGEELIWMEAHCPLREIRSIRMELSDPYADAEGHIDPRYRGLGGSWLDSAPNALAPLLRLQPDVPLTEVTVRHERDRGCGLPYRSAMRAKAGSADVTIDVRWDIGLNLKRTMIEADGHRYVLNHSEQSVERDGELLFKAEGVERLVRQYGNFYEMCPERVPTEAMTQQMIDIIYNNV